MVWVARVWGVSVSVHGSGRGRGHERAVGTGKVKGIGLGLGLGSDRGIDACMDMGKSVGTDGHARGHRRTWT